MSLEPDAADDVSWSAWARIKMFECSYYLCDQNQLFFFNTQIKNQILLPGFKVLDKRLRLFLEASSPSPCGQPSAASRAQRKRQVVEAMLVHSCLELWVHPVTPTVPSAIICRPAGLFQELQQAAEGRQSTSLFLCHSTDVQS
ncbi:unnamed protein product [Rangifer tarandus platyrhynchus]|uniref:Uncharacterized protein n=1 Tax=Rangifer tarandus platyrhynchus TaxID=3082113 RepID=A0AC59Z1X0_RANTA